MFKRFYHTPLRKRAMDLLLVWPVFLVALPILVFASIGIYVTMGGPVLFRQSRIGINGEVFDIVKFRTMKKTLGPDGVLLDDHLRRHWFGDFLRSTSLDELPTLINIAKGDMSFVGPRPLMVKYLPRYSEVQMRRHDVLPGLTGLAQISGRNCLDWEDKFDLDLEYIEKWSVRLDIQILAETLKAVTMQVGADGADLTTEFMGSGDSVSTGEG